MAPQIALPLGLERLHNELCVEVAGGPQRMSTLANKGRGRGEGQFERGRMVLVGAA